MAKSKRGNTSAGKMKGGGTRAGNPKSGTSSYLRRPNYGKLNEAGDIRPKKKKSGK